MMKINEAVSPIPSVRSPSKRAKVFAVLPWVLSAAVFYTANASADTADVPPKAVQQLVATLNERLGIGDIVASSKWHTGKSVQDSERESQVLDSVRKRAAALGLAPQTASELFAAQIEANKLVQYGLLNQWRTSGQPPQAPPTDLAGQVRPRLDELQERLLQQYAAFAPYVKGPRCQGWVAQARKALNNDPLHTLALVRATGEVCSALK
ncbi:chorismate mutase [Pseudomonas tolaasii]